MNLKDYEDVILLMLTGQLLTSPTNQLPFQFATIIKRTNYAAFSLRTDEKQRQDKETTMKIVPNYF